MTIQTDKQTFVTALDKLDERVSIYAYTHSESELEAIANDSNHHDRILAILALGEAN